jgi:hypothetical protein
MTDEQSKPFADIALVSVLLGRVRELDEPAKAVVFLAPDDSSFVNAIELFVDGSHGQT